MDDIRSAAFLVVGLIAGGGVGCGRDTPADGGRHARAPAYAYTVVAIDSASAERAASEALGTSDGRRYRLLSLTRDDSGAVLALVPECPPPDVCAGGGGRVHVGLSGRATVLERYR